MSFQGGTLPESRQIVAREDRPGSPAATDPAPGAPHWLAAAAVGGFATIAALILSVRTLTLRVPLDIRGDANFMMLTVKGLTEGRWFYTNGRVGAPFGLEMYDFPDGGHIPFAILKALGWLTGGDVGLTFNLFYLFTFFAVAATGYWVLVRFGVARHWAAALAVLYAFLPFHLSRVYHLYLMLYVAAPLAILLAVRQVEGPPAFVVDDAERRRLRGAWRTTHTRVAVITAVVLGLTGAYYALFAMVTLAAVAILAYAADRDRLRAASTLLVTAVVAATLLITLVPTIVYRATHGPNSVAVRTYDDVERFALRPVHLLLPIPNHRIEILGEPMIRASQVPTPTERGSNLGVVGAVGVVALLAIGLGTLIRGGSSRSSPRIRLLAGLSISLMLVAVSGGFGATLGLLGFTQIRAWNRMVVFIAFAVFAAVGTWLTRWWERRPRDAWLAWTLAGLLAIVGMLDQSGGSVQSGSQRVGTVPEATRAREAEWYSDAEFVARIEALLPQGAMVFQMPYVYFPEHYAKVEQMLDYDHLKGYLHSDDLRWSYGGMRGRVPAWEQPLIDRGLPDMIEGLVAIGFDGIYIDRFGYADNAAALEAALHDHLEISPIVSANGRLAFFDLRDAAADQRTRLAAAEVIELARTTLMVERLP